MRRRASGPSRPTDGGAALSIGKFSRRSLIFLSRRMLEGLVLLRVLVICFDEVIIRDKERLMLSRCINRLIAAVGICACLLVTPSVGFCKSLWRVEWVAEILSFTGDGQPGWNVFFPDSIKISDNQVMAWIAVGDNAASGPCYTNNPNNCQTHNGIASNIYTNG